MSLNTSHEITGYSCDRCGVTRAFDRPQSYFSAYEGTRREALRNGWKIFAGRGQRWYCPACVAAGYPKPGHQMYEVTS